MENPLQRSDATASDPILIDATADEKLTVAAADIGWVSIIKQSDESKIAAAQRLATPLTVADAMNFARSPVRPFLWTNSATLSVPSKRLATSSPDAFYILAIAGSRWTLETV